MGLFSLTEKQLSGDLIVSYNNLNANYLGGRTKYFPVLAGGKIRGNSPKGSLGSCSLNTGKKLFTRRVGDSGFAYPEGNQWNCSSSGLGWKTMATDLVYY